jgi:hypothetical protein
MKQEVSRQVRQAVLLQIHQWEIGEEVLVRNTCPLKRGCLPLEMESKETSPL